MMRAPCAVLLGALLMASVSFAEQPDASVAKARSALAPYKKALFHTLQEAVARGGPRSAIDVCRLDAPRLAAEASSDGVRVGRSSHRLRNPSNAPAQWLRPLLEELRKDPEGGPGWRSVGLEDGSVGYAEAIVTKPLCVSCHGAAVDPVLLDHIRERYPEDRAVGFEVGSMRGVFWAIVPGPP